MKHAAITRGVSSDEGTFGALQLDGGPLLRSTELPWRDNAPRKSCIPTGTYRCEIRWSNRFARQLYEVKDVPGRSDILIHGANFGGDTEKGWKSDLMGCIGPAMTLGVIMGQRAGQDSAKALKALMDWAGGEPFELVIR